MITTAMKSKDPRLPYCHCIQKWY